MRVRGFRRSWFPRIALVVAGVTVACAAATTSPDIEIAGNRIVVNDPGNRLNKFQTLRPVLESALNRVVRVLPADGVTITVTADPGQAIAGYGVGGRTPDRRTVMLFIDPAFPNLASLLEDRVGRLVAHEFHHAVRWRSPGYGSTLGTAMVSEGMADHFSAELFGEPVPPWCDAFTPDQDQHWLELAGPILRAPTYSHDAWFFGATPALPRWTAYTLGYRLVAAYVRSHPGTSGASLVTASAELFLPR